MDLEEEYGLEKDTGAPRFTQTHEPEIQHNSLEAMFNLVILKMDLGICMTHFSLNRAIQI